MTERVDPVTGGITGMSGSMGGGWPTPTREQCALAQYHDEFAKDVLPLIDSGKNWFTAYEIRQHPPALAPLVDAKVITIHKSTQHDGHYYKTTPVTRKFCLVALALREERCKRMAERAGGEPGTVPAD